MKKYFVFAGKALLHVKHRKREPEGVHGQLEGCNRNLWPKAAVVAKLFHRRGIFTVLYVPGEKMAYAILSPIALNPEHRQVLSPRKNIV